MLFNSLPFWLFFVVVLSIYWCLSWRQQNSFLLGASYFFYGLWEYKFLALIVLSTAVDYSCALLIHKAHQVKRTGRAKFFLWASVVVNLTILLFFKLYGFFVAEFKGHHMMNHFESVDILIPIGISFYTFQTMSYTIDVYRQVMTPTRSFVDFALYVSYFPQLVAGPIERAKNLLTQIQAPRRFHTDRALNGLYLIIWGLFLKVVLADNQAAFITSYFDRPYETNSTVLALLCYAGTLQIYGDFAGYSCMAIGISALLGIRLSDNFKHPFLTASPQEFWSRWHITLVDWFRSYLYYPLLYKLKRGMPVTAANAIAQTTSILAIALWHGITWTFLVWGWAHAVLYFLYRTGKKVLPPQAYRGIPRVLAVFLWFNIFTFVGILFRSRSLADLPLHMENLVRGFAWQGMDIFLGLMAFAPLLLAVEYWHHRHRQAYFFASLPEGRRLLLALFFYLLILLCGVQNSWSFIYFQF